jgi:hypothetical protein
MTVVSELLHVNGVVGVNTVPFASWTVAVSVGLASQANGIGIELTILMSAGGPGGGSVTLCVSIGEMGGVGERSHAASTSATKIQPQLQRP